MSLIDVVRVTGSDACTFLQGQLTQDIRENEDPAAPLAAWCNPKGRVIAIVRVLRTGAGEFLLGVPSGLAGTLVKRLLMFRFRARVEIAGPGPDFTVLAFASEGDRGTLNGMGLLPEPGSRRPSRGAGLLAVETGAGAGLVEVYGRLECMKEAGLAGGLSAEEWERMLIDAGVATIKESTAEKYTPHMLNLDRLGAISFSKGCYTGQEVVARTQHLGRSKRRLMHFRAAGAGAAAGDRVQQDGREVGEVVNAVGEHLLAVVPLAANPSLSWEGKPLLPLALPYSLD